MFVDSLPEFTLLFFPDSVCECGCMSDTVHHAYSMCCVTIVMCFVYARYAINKMTFLQRVRMEKPFCIKHFTNVSSYLCECVSRCSCVKGIIILLWCLNRAKRNNITKENNTWTEHINLNMAKWNGYSFSAPNQIYYRNEIYLRAIFIYRETCIVSQAMTPHLFLFGGVWDYFWDTIVAKIFQIQYIWQLVRW